MSDPKPNPVNDELGGADAKNSQVPLPKDDTAVKTIVGMLLKPHTKTRKFWETQPVAQLKNNTSLPEGPIEPATLVAKVRQEPYNLPGQFEWTICDLSSDDGCSEVYNFLKAHYSDSAIVADYPREFLRWAMCPPGYYQSWHIGVRVKTSKKLVAFIGGVPMRIRVRDEVIKMAKAIFLCVHKKLRFKGLAPVMIREVTRRVRLQNIWKGVYTSRVDVLSKPVASCRYWVRMLNPQRSQDVSVRFSERMTLSMTIKLYKLPDAPITPGFRQMERRDVPAVTELLRNYLCQFELAADFDEDDVKHWFLPRENVIYSYLVVSPETHDVTDFCSFYTFPATLTRDQTPAKLKYAYSYYNVATVTSFPQLMNDVLIIAKRKGCDMFYASEAMNNTSFLKACRFNPGNGLRHYYLYNYRLRSALKPSELGLVL
ncbi:PREDICTED: putative glycylpeptide N-tetradecanoyltransferase 2 [Camelina sativa]|uniref:Glycylpeptide N-tetradecanoyltransferase n=1 Tax=Camelina sativa TaxID=90675 RepID=A0ABM0ZBS8_CAMSA|nr:PREDICTED: putative glycylpeptide N-tetradecanoyltransferase 2 [Camelina sativa]